MAQAVKVFLGQLVLYQKDHSTKNPPWGDRALQTLRKGGGATSHGTDRRRAAGSDLCWLHVIQTHGTHRRSEEGGMGGGQAGEGKQATARLLL